MTPLDPAVRTFRWKPNWPWLLCEAGLAAVLLAAGLALGAAAERVWGASDWSMLASVLLWVVTAALMFVCGGLFLIVATLVSCHGFGWVAIASVHRDGVWITQSPHTDLFPKTVIVPFDTIARVERERGGVRIVYGPDLKAESVSELRPADLDALLAVLAERCPAAVIQPRSA